MSLSISNSKILIAKFVLFTALMIGILGALGMALEKCAVRFDHNERKVHDVVTMDGKDFDVLVLGNSVAQQGIDPRVLQQNWKCTSYNQSVGGASIIESAVLLQHYLSKNSQPSLVLFGLTINRASMGDGLRPSVSLRVSPDAKKYYERFVADHGVDVNRTVEFLSSFRFFRYRSALEHASKWLFNQNRSIHFVNGFLEITRTKPVNRGHRTHLSGISAAGLRAIDRLCDQRGIQIIYVELPNTAAFNATTAGRESTLAVVRQLVGDRFISLNSESVISQLDDACWVSDDHLNATGAKLVTTILSESDQIRRWIALSSDFPHDQTTVN